MNYDDELKQLKEYLFVYIQLLNHKINYLPTFEYYKEMENDPRYTLTYGISRDVIPNGQFGYQANVRNGRFINYWCGVKFYPPRDYFVLTESDLWEK